MKTLTLLAAGLVALALSACNGTAPTLTFQQQVSLVCLDADAAVKIMTDDGVFTGGAQTTLTKDFQPALAKVCAAGATATTPNLQSLTNVALPLLKSLVSASTLTQQAKNDANTAIDLTVLAINTAIVLQPAAVPTTASAPAATSTSLAGAPLQ